MVRRVRLGRKARRVLTVRKATLAPLARMALKVRRVTLAMPGRRVRTVPQALMVPMALLARLRCLPMRATRASWALMV